MAELLQTKIDCLIRFSHDSGLAINKEYTGLIHLMEYDYGSPDVPLFWFGVIDVACTAKEFSETGFLGPCDGVRVNISLPDGREGWARYTQAHGCIGQDGCWYFRLPVHGQGPLVIPTSN